VLRLHRSSATACGDGPLAIERECLGSPAVIVVGDVLRGVPTAQSCLSEKGQALA